PKHIRWSKQLAMSPTEIDIPSGTVARIDGYTFLNKNARIISFQPHMHIRGKRQCLELIYPTSGAAAKTEVVSCANFNYNWHLNYSYADDAAPIVPKGTILHTITWHDNSTANKNNPDPKNCVGSFRFHFGYLNRNYVQALSIPVGPANSIEPGGPDRGQPTFFAVRTNRNMFTVTVPKDWGKKELVWTLTANGKTQKAFGW